MVRKKKDKLIRNKNGRITLFADLGQRPKGDLELMLCNNKGKELDRVIFKNGRI
jgi:hypothetical protein